LNRAEQLGMFPADPINAIIIYVQTSTTFHKKICRLFTYNMRVLI
jgi:hypothetical protein